MNTTIVKTLGMGIVLSLATSTFLHATNGDNLIAVGTKARAMGGTGMAIYHGAESILINPAMITSIEDTEISFGGTVFLPNIETAMGNNALASSSADTNIIPEFSIAHKFDENWYIGAGMFGTAGMGTDFRDTGKDMFGNNTNMHMYTNLQLLQFIVPVAYKYEGFSVAVTPVIQYGNLRINYDGTLDASNAGMGKVNMSSDTYITQDFGFGFTVGAGYNFDNGLILGAMYKSAIEMEYPDQLTNAMAPLVAFGMIPAGTFTDVLEQPAEFGAGFSYTLEEHTVTFDYKNIAWSSAIGYGDFGWEDQNVFSGGYQYAKDNWAVRAGFNYAAAAVVDVAGGGTDPEAAALNFFNMLGFPATAEQHYTFGGTYNVNDAFGVDLAFVYSPETKYTFDTSVFKGFGAQNPETVTSTHQENSVSIQLTYNF